LLRQKVLDRTLISVEDAAEWRVKRKKQEMAQVPAPIKVACALLVVGQFY